MQCMLPADFDLFEDFAPAALEKVSVGHKIELISVLTNIYRASQKKIKMSQRSQNSRRKLLRKTKTAEMPSPSELSPLKTLMS